MKNKAANRRFPFNTELLEYGRKTLGVGNQVDTQESDRMRVAALIGFIFLLRASGLAALEWRDIMFGASEEGRYVRIFIRKPKTDQSEVGVSRSLNDTGGGGGDMPI